MRAVHIDIETYSEVDLPKVGAHRYARDPSTRVLLLAYAVDDNPVRVVDLHHGEDLPRELLDALADPGTVKWAHNAAFERACLEAVLGIPCPPDQWRCTMVWAMSLGLPAGLAKLADEIKADARKLDPDKRLVQVLCTPRHGGPDAPENRGLWEEFKAYNLRDVETERAIHHRLARYPVPPAEWALWALDQQINDIGLPIDLPFAVSAAGMAARNAAQAGAAATDATGIANAGSRDQLLEWLRTAGLDLDDLRRETVETLLSQEELDPQVRAVLEMRQEMASSSLAKYDALQRATCPDGRIRGTMQFYGAPRTGRWAGRIFQPHNLPRGSLPPDEIAPARELVAAEDLDLVRAAFGTVSPVLASLVRTVIVAPPGRRLVVADYASIESVMLAWAAESDYLLGLFQRGLDPYKDFATRLFGVTYDEVTKRQRTLAKPAVLGGGYGLGARGLKAYAAGFGLQLSDREASKHIDTFRSAYPDIPRFWSAVESAALSAVSDKTEARAGRFVFRLDGPFLFVDLPCGRALSYYRPRVGVGDYGRDQLTYAGREPSVRLGTHAGKIVENLVQAVARDVLAAGLLAVERTPGLAIVGHVHDEILCEADDDDETALDRLIGAMTERPDWCQDAPIRAAGWTGHYYRKE